MSLNVYQKDLVVLTADRNSQFAIRGILERHKSLGIRPLKVDFYTHPERDAGLFLRSQDFLRPFATSHQYALAVMDRVGCGQEQLDRTGLEKQIEDALHGAGWADRAVAVVPDPELEIWVWSDSPNVDDTLGWKGHQPDLRAWLQSNGYTRERLAKPDRPKEAMEHALRLVHKSRSSAIYEQLALRVSLSRCQDAAFLRLKDTLRRWFCNDMGFQGRQT